MTTERRVRLTVVLTHPIQYFAPWFRYIDAHVPAIALTVLYEKRPTAKEQGASFGTAFEWDISPLDGYRSIVLTRAGDASGGPSTIGSAIEATTPDVVLVPGWHSPFYRRALTECRRRHIPVLYRGDSTLQIRHRGLAEVAWTLRTQMRLTQFDAYLSVGIRSRQFLEELGAPSDRIFDSPHAVDNAFFSAAAAPYTTAEGRRAARERFGIGGDEFVVLFAGKLDAIKRPLDAVQAAAAAKATLLVAGDGALRPAMVQEAARTGARMHLAGFLNQSQMPHAYAAADCLVLPSERETWGLVVNEAMATGLPCIASETCGCAPDLISAETGAVFPAGNIPALQRAIESVATQRRLGHSFEDACRQRIASFGYAQASAGLVEACAAVAAATGPEPLPRVLLWAGHFVALGGMERTAIDVARVAINRGGRVRFLVNRWDSTRIRTEVESFGATWSTVFHRQPLSRRLRKPVTTARMLLDVAVSSLELRHAVARCRATHVIMPDFAATIRSAPAIAWMRLRGQPTIVSIVQNAPTTSSLFYRAMWRYLIGPLTTRFVCNSRFTQSELAKNGVRGPNVEWIYNMAPTRNVAALEEPTPPADVVYVGQLIPEKGVSVLLEAVAALNRRGRTVTLNVVGDLTGWVHPLFHGYRESLIARADAPDLAGRVRFLGWREDIPNVMNAASIHCCPSLIELREAFGNVVAEAKSCGKPSVVTRSGALPEIVEHRLNGWVCDEVTAEKIAEGIDYFLSDPERLRDASRAAHESYVRSFGREHFERRWAQVLGLPAMDRAPGECAAPLAMKQSASDGHHDETI
jgi:glycosyltransferase involved in cell wall biosynthesis